jgi:hypothetical protein
MLIKADIFVDWYLNIRLKCCLVTTCIWIKPLNGSQKGIGIFSSSAVILVDVGHDKPLRRTPEALEKTQYLRSLGVAVCACLPQLSCKRTPFYKGTMLCIDGEKTRAIDFFP